MPQLRLELTVIHVTRQFSLLDDQVALFSEGIVDMKKEE